MQKGFTLVELSIVLVIIGLLVGGILVGQSLIDAAKLNSLVRQFQQYDAAANSFKSKYKFLPGDAGVGFIKSSTGTPGQTSLREGLLTDENTQNNSLRYLSTGTEEYLLFWLDLARLSSFAPDNCPQLKTRVDPFAGGTGIRKDGDNCNVAEATYGEEASTIVPAAYDIYSPTTSSAGFISGQYAPYNSYFLGDCLIAGSPFFACEPTFTNVQALAIDSKLDNGISNSGDVTAFTNTGWTTFRINDKTLAANYQNNTVLLSISVKMNAR